MTSQQNDDLHAVRQQEAIDRLERIETVAGDLKDAKLPPTNDIARAVDSVTESKSLQAATQDMSPAGQKAVEDARLAAQAGKNVFVEKNQGELLQKAVYHGSRAAGHVGGTLQGKLGERDIVGEHFAGASEIASKAGRRIMDLGRLLISSPEFRHLLNDLQELAQDAFGTVLDTAAPSIAQQKQGDLTQDSAIQYDQNQNGRTQAETTGDLSQIARERQDELTGNISQAARERAPEVYQRAHQTVEPLVDRFSRGETTAANAAREIGGKVADTARETTQNLKERVMSPEYREQLAQRFKALMIDFQSHPEFQAGVDELTDLAKDVTRRTVNASAAVADTAAETADEHASELRQARDATRQLIENFAGGRSLTPLTDVITEFGNDVIHDQELSQYFNDLSDFFHRSARELGFVNSDSYIPAAEDMLRRGREVIADKHEGHFDAVNRELRELFSAMAAERGTQEFTSHMNDLLADLFLDEQGRPTVKFDLVRDFARLLPVIAEKLEYLPIPRVEGSDDDIDYSLDNMVLRCTNLIPRHLHFHTYTSVEMHPPVPFSDRVQSAREKAEFRIRNRVEVHINQIRADARDIAFYFKKKTGMARLSDYGTADVAIPDRGISLHIALSTDDRSGPDRIFYIERAEAEIHELKLSLQATKHDLLFKMLNPILTMTARKQVSKAMSERLRALLEKINDQLAVMAKQAKEAAKETAAGVARTAKNTASSLRETTDKASETYDKNKEPLMEQARSAVDQTKNVVTDKAAGYERKPREGVVYEE